ncbi:MAG: ABC transporter permease [Thermomicrobiales bacterium]|nr:ABC transporter permease [Thermomicrobiales bacterium]
MSATRSSATRNWSWLGLAPLSLWQGIFYFVPAVLLFLTSFWVLERYSIVMNWTLANYQQVFAKRIYLDAYLTSLWISVSTVVICILLAYPAAYAVAFVVPRRWQRACMIAMIIPFWTNYLVRAYAWQLVLSNNGLLNYTLLRLGLREEPLPILYTHVATRIGLVHFLVVLLTLALYARMESIDRSLLEAARDLGASRIRAFVEVVLPLTRGALVTGVMFIFVLAFADYVSPAILGGQTRRVFPQLVVDAIQSDVNYPLAAAFATVMVATILVVIGLLSRMQSSGEIES